MKTVPIQLRQERRSTLGNEVQEKFYYHTRKEFLQLRCDEPLGDTKAETLFEEAERCVNELMKEDARSVQKNTVGLIGQPGVGKTTLTKDILYNIVYNRWYEADFIFYLKLRDCQYDAESDLLTFLTSNSVPLQFCDNENRRRAVLDQLEENERVVILFDGYDEATIRNINKGANRYSRETPEVFLKQILLGNIFPKSKKLITSRPKQFYDLPLEYKPKFVVSLTGIDREAQLQLCEYICGESSDDVFQSVSNQPDLFSYCFVPVLCTLLMHCMKNLQFRPGTKIPKTLSNLFVLILSLFMNDTSHCIVQQSDEDKTVLQSHLRYFAGLAWRLFKEKQYYFSPSELKNAGFSKEERLGFLDTILAKGMRAVLLGGSPKKLMYFTHLLWQEFLVAMHYIFFTSPEEFEELLSKNLNLKEGRMEMVTKFLFGLCNLETIKILSEDFSLIFPSQQITTVKKWGLDQLRRLTYSELYHFHLLLPIISLTHEMNDDSFGREIAEAIPDYLLIRGDINLMDINVLRSLFNAKKSLLETGNRKSYDIAIEKIHFVGSGLKPFFQEMKNAIALNAVKKVRFIDS